jgi:transcriptional regulator with XRE-family HTH domain
MTSAGSRLKEARLRLGLRFRDVEAASKEIARRHGNEEFIIALSRLADIENKGTQPSIARLYSLCAIYRLEIAEVLTWYGVPASRLAEDALLCKQPSTHILPTAPLEENPPLAAISPQEGRRRETPLVTAGSAEPRRGVPTHQWVADSILGRPRKRALRMGMIGERDTSMAPILPPGSVVMIDDTRKRVATSGWQSELDRPIYFLETREGYLCRWCSLEGEELIAIPHPSSNQAPRRFRHPSEAELVGEVIGVTMQRPQVRQSRTRS